MTRKRFAAEEIIHKLREAEVLLAQGKKTPEVCRKLGVTEDSYSQCTSCHSVAFSLVS